MKLGQHCPKHHARLHRTGTTELLRESACLRCGAVLAGQRRKWCSNACKLANRTPIRSCVTCGQTLDGQRKTYCERGGKCARIAVRASIYGLTPAELLALYELQGWACAICGAAEPKDPTKGETLHVDHNHETGAVRGLLCGRCNVALGMIRDDASVALRMASYLGTMSHA